MKEIKTISIKCETKDFLKLAEITEFQGELKKRNEEDINKIVKSIKKYGFCYPFFVWKHDGINHILDGHGRYAAMKKLDELGFIIPELPVVYVDCKDEQSARDLLLRLNSSYGKMSKESVLEFIGDFDIDLSNFELAAGIISFDTEEEFDFDDEPEPEEPRNKLGVLVSCETEQEMEQVFYKLQKMGLSCKMVE